MGYVYGNQPCIDPRRVAQQLGRANTYTVVDGWVGQANRYTCPLGDSPGRGTVLMYGSDLGILGLFNQSGGGTAYDLKINELRTLTFKNLHPIRAKCITPGHEDDPKAIYALELADDRYYINQYYTAAAYNVRLAPDGDYIDETTHDGAGTPWTWDQLGSDLWDDLNIDDAWPGWPFTPHGTPEGWHFWQQPSIQCFQAVARRIGCSLRYNPFEQTFGIVRLGSTDTSFDDSVESLKKQYVRWDDRWVEPYPPSIPEKIRVVFRRVTAEATGNPYETREINFPDSELLGYAQEDTRVVLWDDLIYTGSNGTDLDDRATERADDYSRIVQYFNPLLHRHYRANGLTSADLFLGSRCSQVTWQDVGDGNYVIIECGPMKPIDWTNYLQGAGETVTSVRCVGGDIQETLLNVWGPKPLRFS